MRDRDPASRSASCTRDASNCRMVSALAFMV
jgi:hypothetical protein